MLENSNTRKLRARSAVLILAAALLMGFPTLRGGFVGGDDHRLALDHVLVNRPSVAHAFALFQIVHRDLYQPLPLLSFQLEFVAVDLLGLKDFGPSSFAWFFHFNNILLHALNSLLVLFLVRALQVPGKGFGHGQDHAETPPGFMAAGSFPRGEAIAVVAALLFAIHPYQTEVVAWLNGRMMLLSTFFLLLALLKQVRWMDLAANAVVSRRRRIATGLWVAFFVLCCNISKVRVEIPILMFLLAWNRGARLDRHFASLFLPCALLTAFFAWLNISATAAADLFAGGEEHLKGPHLVRVILALGFYFEHLVWPTGLASYYPTPPIVYWSDPETIRAFFIVGIALSILLYGALLRRSARVGAAWFFVAIAATLPFVPARNILAADRYMYIPIIGLLWPMADVLVAAYRSLVERFPRRPITRWAVMFATVLAATFVSLCWYTAWFYEDPIKKTYRVAMLNPDVPRSWERVGWSYYEVGDYEKAVECANKELKHDNPAVQSGAMQLLGMTALRRGDSEEAIRLLNRALEIDPSSALGRFRLAMAYDDLERPADALPHFEAAAREAPTSNPTLHRLAAVYRQLGDPAGARRCYEQELRNNPYEWPASIGLVELDLEAATPESHQAAERRLLDLLAWMPENPPARINLGVVLHALGRTEESVRAYRNALALDPRNATAALNLAQLLVAQGDLRSAAKYFELAAGTGPTSLNEAAAIVDFFVSQNQPERAVAVANAFAAHTPNSNDAAALTVWARLMNGNLNASNHQAWSAEPMSPMARMVSAYLAFLERRFAEAVQDLQKLDVEGNQAADVRRRLLAAFERFDQTHPNEPWTFCLAAELLIANDQLDAARAAAELCSQRCKDPECGTHLRQLQSRFSAP